MRLFAFPALLPIALTMATACGDTPPPNAPAQRVDVKPASSGSASAEVEQAPDGRVKLPPIGAADKIAAEGRVYADRGDYPAALRRFEDSYRIEPSDEVLYDIGFTLERMGRKREAANVYQKLLQGDLTSSDRASMEQRIQQLREPGPP